MSAAALKQSESPPKRIKKTKAELIQEIEQVEKRNKSAKSKKALEEASQPSRKAEYKEKDYITVKSTPKLLQQRNLMQRIPSSSKRLHKQDTSPQASYLGIPLKPVKIMNAQ